MKTPVEQAIERAMARIGCTPGDNSDADLYNELAAALASLKTESPAPLVSDERMRAYNGDQLMDPEDVRYEYESDRAKMRAERDELAGALRWLYITAAQSSWAHIENPQVKCDCKRCAVLNAGTLLSKYNTK